MFKYPHNISEIIKENIIKNKIFDRIEYFPSEKILNEILEIAYHASFLKEELRKIRFGLIYCSKDEKILKENYEVVPFEKERNFEIIEILRLAPATDPTNVLIGVYSYNNKLKIWGFINIGSSWIHYIRGESRHAHLPPPFLTIYSNEPGNLVISSSGITHLELRLGKYYKPILGIFKNGPIGNFFSKSRTYIINDILEKLNKNEFEIETSFLENAEKSIQNFIERLLFSINEKKHGGTLIFIPDDFIISKEFINEKLLIKYLCNYDKIWKNLVNYIVVNYELYELLLSESTIEEDKENCISSNIILNEYMFYNDKCKIIEQEITNSINFLSSLSQIDGAIVLTDKFRLIGFGSEVIVKNTLSDTIKLTFDTFGKKGEYIPIDSFGTRHRSTFRFCSNIENSCAFVISKDGSIRAVKNHNNELLLWPDLELFNPID